MASAVQVGGASGGSTHVAEVACGLRALGHDVLVVARRGPGAEDCLGCGVPVRFTRWPRQLAMLGAPRLAAIFRRFKPDVVIERFYNFAGWGVWLAHRHNIPALLEVNAPMIDPPGSMKPRLDRLLLGSMRRWAVRQAKWSAAIITPLSSTVPAEVPSGKIVQLPWGANVDRFNPDIRAAERGRLAALSAELGLEEGAPVAVFLGSFRAWHGASGFAQVAYELISGGANLAFLAIGSGPELGPLREKVRGWGLPDGKFVFAGAQPHERVPQLLALADVGVAPFDLEAYPPLSTFGFYWSPLKVFEYMAMGLPVVTVDVPPLNRIVRQDKEGLLYPPGDLDVLAKALRRLATDGGLRERLGRAARARVSAHYSWQAHCRALDLLLRTITGEG